MANAVCLDASFVLAMLFEEASARRARELWAGWLHAGVEAVSAPLLFAEVTSVLREGVYFKRVSPEDGEQLFSDFSRLPIISADFPGLSGRAWEIAKRYNRPRAYDAHYLAVAAHLGCELWTGDRRLANAVSTAWVKVL